MACRLANVANNIQPVAQVAVEPVVAPIVADITETLAAVPVVAETIENTNQDVAWNGQVFFGVDSEAPANALLQHNLLHFDWVTVNKLYPNFWGRYIGGEKAITPEEVQFLHEKGCKIVPIYAANNSEEITTEVQGIEDARRAFYKAKELGIGLQTVIFLKIPEQVTVQSEYLLGFARTLLSLDYIPGFYANTDAKGEDFSHQFSRGFMNEPEVFGKCEIWAISPSLPEFFETVNAHTLYPDSWKPHSPSCMTRERIAIWQYGRGCHPINDDLDNPVSFNANLVRNSDFLIEKLF